MRSISKRRGARPVNERQRIAYAHPCARAWETTDDRFYGVMDMGRLHYSTVFTVNK